MERQIVNIDPEIMGGTPVFWGTRVPIKNLFDYLEAGETIDFFLDDFPSIKREHVIRVLAVSLKLVNSNPKVQYENIA